MTLTLDRLTPASLELPPKFERFRDVQLEALEQIKNSQKRFIMLQAPTGSGKSPIVAALQRLLKTRVLYSCHTIQLQEQFLSDFSHDLRKDRFAVVLKGRANYPTLRFQNAFPKINGSMCTGSKEKHCRWCCNAECGGEDRCSVVSRCPYRLQKFIAKRSSLAVVNMSLFLNEANYVGEFSGWPWLCLDEADLTERALMSFVELVLTEHWIQKLGLSPPKHKTVEEAWAEWAQLEALPAVRKELDYLSRQYGVQDLQRENELKRMETKLGFFLQEVANKGKWVFMPGDTSWVFKPVYVSKYAERYLWKHAERFLLMSATLISPNEMAYSLGIPREQVDFIDLPSMFPASRRPIYYLPAANLTKKTERTERPKAVAALDTILDKHLTEQTLVHTVSYGYASQVCKMSRHKRRMITYNNAGDRQGALGKFLTGKPGSVLVASSMDRGVDLHYDLCRVVVVMKIPFPNLGDKQVSARLYSDKRHGQLWYTVATVRSLVQMCGRAMRAEDDKCTIYVLDSQFERLYKEWKYLFPAWWREALRTQKVAL